MRDKRVTIGAILQPVLLLAATLIIGRGGLEANAEACATCVTQGDCKTVWDGFASCKVEAGLCEPTYQNQCHNGACTK
jgi:hypothetical protein